MTKLCIQCGKENRDVADFCRNCGEKLEGSETSNPYKKANVVSSSSKEIKSSSYPEIAFKKFIQNRSENIPASLDNPEKKKQNILEPAKIDSTGQDLIDESKKFISESEKHDGIDKKSKFKEEKNYTSNSIHRRDDFVDGTVNMFQGVEKQKIKINVKISKTHLILSNGVQIDFNDISNLIHRSGKKPKLTIKLKDGSGIALYPDEKIDDSNILKDMLRESLISISHKSE